MIDDIDVLKAELKDIADERESAHGGECIDTLYEAAQTAVQYILTHLVGLTPEIEEQLEALCLELDDDT